jgi:hypothetical protein
MAAVQTMNMTDTNRERSLLFDIAEITGFTESSGDDRNCVPRAQQDEIAIIWHSERAVFSSPLWKSASWKLRLAMSQAVLATFDCLPNAPAARLRWLFTSKVVDKTKAADLLIEWVDKGAPPVLEFIDFIIEDLGEGRLIRTFGLAAIVGHEIDAVIPDSDHHDLAKMVAHLAQDVLRNGPLDTSEAVGPDGQEYRLISIPKQANIPPTVRVTIL